MKAQFKKTSSGWRVAVDGKVDVDGGHSTIPVSMRDGSCKMVTLTRYFSREGDLYLYTPVSDKRPINTHAQRHSYREPGICQGCEYNQDAGDMQGCSLHRGNPRV